MAKMTKTKIAESVECPYPQGKSIARIMRRRAPSNSEGDAIGKGPFEKRLFDSQGEAFPGGKTMAQIRKEIRDGRKE